MPRTNSDLTRGSDSHKTTSREDRLYGMALRRAYRTEASPDIHITQDEEFGKLPAAIIARGSPLSAAASETEETNQCHLSVDPDAETVTYPGGGAILPNSSLEEILTAFPFEVIDERVVESSDAPRDSMLTDHGSSATSASVGVGVMLAHDVEEYMNSQHASMIVESSDCDLLPDELFNDSRYSEDEVDRGTGAEGKDYEPDPIYATRAHASKLAYRTSRNRDPDLTEDIFDGEHFNSLLHTYVSWGGEIIQPARRYFENDTDLALGLSTDGVSPFKRSDLDISGDDLDSIEKGLAHWVADYERLYYRCSPNNLPFCTAPIHGLLHLAKYIRMQGPPAVYWGFSTERFVGWLKTASYNRQLPVTALGNIVETQEQIHQVLSTLGDDNFHKVIMWERGRKARPTWMQDHSEAKLFERMSDNYQFNNAELHCLYNFLTARAFESDHIWMRYERVNVTMAEVAATTFRVFSAWRSNDDDGRQTYRTQESHRAVTRDASWCRFDQIRDRNERRASGPAVWQRIAQPLWGEVLHFVEFSWREETLQVAIVQSWNTQPWLSGRERAVFADTAWELTTKGCLLAMEVRSLRHVAARVKLDGRHEKYVIFETSLGLLVPELI
ncbi:hypothetical protein QFC19_003329 [Naganishia cerealis]|uniref:Uncharacterized protein n=1 Tax=Naganishia cerealis TaxID=610337 RepID=A0ACC2W406_9TREE|nr:hypothetical protein QFC19_003329 [Naganishia cerealis]